MNKKSELCTYMYEHGKDWRTYFEMDYPGIFFKDMRKEDPDCPYVTFMYTVKEDFKEPLVQEARGIIINEETCEVVCWPFRKFGKWDDNYADKIDWSTAVAREKLDGAIIKLWFDTYKNKWVFSTNFSIYAENASLPRELKDSHCETYMDAIKSALNYKLLKDSIERNELDRDKTYIFELTSPYTRILIRYSLTSLNHIGTRNNLTGEEADDNICIEKPHKYENLHSLDDCIRFSKYMSENEGVVENCQFEGLVVTDANFNRVKVKSDIYTILHNIANGNKSAKKSSVLLIQRIIDGTIDIDSLAFYYPEIAHFLKYYNFKITEFYNRCEAYVSICREIYCRSGYDKSVIGKLVKDHPYKKFVFTALDNLDYFGEVFGDNVAEGLYKVIGPYTTENYSYLFKEYDKLKKEKGDEN